MTCLFVFSIFSSWWSDWPACTHASVRELLFLFCWLEDLETAHKGVINRHHGSSVVEFTAIVRSREESDKLPLSKEFISIFYNLMGSTDQVNIVFLVKC